MLLEMERIVLDPTQPVAAGIMAAKVVLPFMLPKPQEPRTVPYDNDEIVRRLQEGRARVAEIPSSARIMAAKVVLPFMLPKPQEAKATHQEVFSVAPTSRTSPTKNLIVNPTLRLAYVMKECA
jgi:hypothetical protein